MNIFDKLTDAQYKSDVSLGSPARDIGQLNRRLNIMAYFTGGKGFRTPPKSPAVDAQGKTRGQRRRELYNRTFGINLQPTI